MKAIASVVTTTKPAAGAGDLAGQPSAAIEPGLQDIIRRQVEGPTAPPPAPEHRLPWKRRKP